MGDRMKRLVPGLIGMLVLAWMALFGWDRWVNAHRIVAGPENESPIYQSYDPEPIIKQFRYEGEGYESGHGKGASQLITYIHHNQDFMRRFTMQADRERQLLSALREDILLRLRMTGMNVVAAHDETDGGFTYRYTFANSVGSISVQAPGRETTERRYPVPSGLDDVELKIALGETWTRPARDSSWWMSAAD